MRVSYSFADAARHPALFGAEGELVLTRVSIDPRPLEDLLEALALLNFPVNPELHHHIAKVSVEFPAYTSNLAAIRAALQSQGFDLDSLEVYGMLHSAK